MLVIRRVVDRRHAYTAIFLPGEPPKIFPTSDREHARVLQFTSKTDLTRASKTFFSITRSAQTSGPFHP